MSYSTLKQWYKNQEESLAEAMEAIDSTVEDVIGSEYYDEVLGVDVDTEQDLLVVHTLKNYKPSEGELREIANETGFSKIHFACPSYRMHGYLASDGRVVVQYG
jgi:hypothetical protein